MESDSQTVAQEEIEELEELEPTIGQLLRDARVEQNLSLDAVVQATRIRLTHIEDIESDRFDRIPSRGYLVGYIRNYSKFLNLDSEEITQKFKSSLSEETELGANSFSRHGDSRGFGEILRTNPSIIFGTLVAIAVLLVAGALWYVFTNTDLGNTDASEEVPSSTQSSVEPVTETTLTVVEESEVQAEDNSSIFSAVDSSGTSAFNTPSSVANEIDPPLENSAEIEQITATTESAPEPVIPAEEPMLVEVEEVEHEPEEEEIASEPQPVLVFEFEDASWIEVSDAEGEVLLNQLGNAGEILDIVDAEPPFEIKLGYAPGVQIQYRGESVELEQYIQNNKMASLVLAP